MASPWSSRTIYSKNNVVTYSGATYVSAQNYNLNRIPQPAGSTWWTPQSNPYGGVNSVTGGTNITTSGTAANVVVNAAAVTPSPAGTYTGGPNIAVDATGRVTSALSGAYVGAAPVSTSYAPLTNQLDIGLLYEAADLALSGSNLALATLAPSVSGTYTTPSSVTVDAKGRVTAIASGSPSGGVASITAGTNISLTGTATDPVINGAAAILPLQTATAVGGAKNIALLYDSVNSFALTGALTDTLTLKTTGGGAGTTANPSSVTVDAFGRVTGLASYAATPLLTPTVYNNSVNLAPTGTSPFIGYSAIIPLIPAGANTKNGAWMITGSLVWGPGGSPPWQINFGPGDFIECTFVRQVGPTPNLSADVVVSNQILGGFASPTLQNFWQNPSWSSTTFPATVVGGFAYYAVITAYNVSGYTLFGPTPTTVLGEATAISLCN